MTWTSFLLLSSASAFSFVIMTIVTVATSGTQVHASFCDVLSFSLVKNKISSSPPHTPFTSTSTMPSLSSSSSSYLDSLSHRSGRNSIGYSKNGVIPPFSGPKSSLPIKNRSNEFPSLSLSVPILPKSSLSTSSNIIRRRRRKRANGQPLRRKYNVTQTQIVVVQSIKKLAWFHKRWSLISSKRNRFSVTGMSFWKLCRCWV